ncbi:hypothetical protein RJ641_015065 [Dillenia turbinata]|uniref:Uncharacterized protein n=1 Tax=Dillenia turbinata TaxID=194707 RepID=A0AAN8V5K3_9MAGN
MESSTGKAAHKERSVKQERCDWEEGAHNNRATSKRNRKGAAGKEPTFRESFWTAHQKDKTMDFAAQALVGWYEEFMRTRSEGASNSVVAASLASVTALTPAFRRPAARRMDASLGDKARSRSQPSDDAYRVAQLEKRLHSAEQASAGLRALYSNIIPFSSASTQLLSRSNLQILVLSHP